MFSNKYLRKYYLKYWFLFLIGIVALIAVDYVQLLIPEQLALIVKIIKEQPVDIESQMLKAIGITLVVGLTMFLGRVCWRFTIFKASSKIEADIRHDMFLKSERLSLSYYHDNKVGNVMAWFTSDIETVEEYLGWGTIMLFDGIFLTILTLFKMFRLTLPLTIVTLIPVLLIVLWGALAEKFMSKKWELRQQAFDSLYDFSQENFTGIRVIKAFVKENKEIHAFAKVARKNKDVNIDFVRVAVIFDVLIEILCGLICCLILGLGGYFVYQSITSESAILFGYKFNLKPEMLVEFIGYFDSLVWPLIAMGQIINMRSRGKASLKRITDFLHQPEDIKNPENAIMLEDCKGEIEIKNFSFFYKTKKFCGLHDINLKINAGEKIGIVGKIGSGKTSLVNVLLRLYNVDENTIFIDGKDIMSLDINSVRENIAYVPQDNFLFSDTIKNNIAFSNCDLKDNEIIDAADFACVKDDIEGFKDKYETVTGERGVTLSGGQKQRVSIARAFIKDAPIMILDDSVSAVDVKTEEQVLKNINEKRAGKTTIVIASRVSTISKMDRIIVLNQGYVEAFDTHENLLKSSETYKKMVYLQQLEKEVEGGN